jgi:hypothetical protein
MALSSLQTSACLVSKSRLASAVLPCVGAPANCLVCTFHTATTLCYSDVIFLVICLQDEVIDLAQVTLAGPSSAVDTPAEELDLSPEELAAAAEATHLSSLAVADIEAAFLEGKH